MSIKQNRFNWRRTVWALAALATIALAAGAKYRPN